MRIIACCSSLEEAKELANRLSLKKIDAFIHDVTTGSIRCNLPRDFAVSVLEINVREALEIVSLEYPFLVPVPDFQICRKCGLDSIDAAPMNFSLLRRAIIVVIARLTGKPYCWNCRKFWTRRTKANRVSVKKS